MKKYKNGLIIGRFQPLHIEHENLIKTALSECENVLVLVGSANKTSCFKNPWPYEDRKQMLLNVFSDTSCLSIEPLIDSANDEDWLRSVYRKMYKHGFVYKSEHQDTWAIYGHNKDNSSYYINEIASYFKIDTVEYKPIQSINATDIRQHLYEMWLENNIHSHVVYTKWGFEPELVVDKSNHPYINIKNNTEWLKEYHSAVEYKKMWKDTPYPVQFQATDAFVKTRDDKIVLIKRKSEHGNDKYALPGGFLEIDLNIQENTKKELLEETGINLDSMCYTLVSSSVFSDPNRSQRGRIVTNVLYYILSVDSEYINQIIKAGSDSKEVRLLSRDEYSKMCINDFFEDHHEIIEHMIGWKLDQVQEYEE